MIDNRHPRRRGEFPSRQAGQDLVLYDSERGRLHVLNPTASAIWDLCDGLHSLDEMAGTLARSFEMSPQADLVQDVKSIIDSFVQEQLLSDVSSAVPISGTAGEES